MLLKKLYVSLINLGFTSVGINRDNISLFQRVSQQDIYIVAIYNCPTGLEYSKDQLSYINKQVTNYYYNKGYVNVNLLGIICTNNVEKVKDVTIDNSNFWIIDTNENKLIIYENQDNKFLNLENQIQGILNNTEVQIDEDKNNRNRNKNYKYPNHINTKSIKNIVSKYMSKYNTIIIACVILVYIIVNIISRESGKEHLVLSGALYWPAIVFQNEYYRLFTYMFLHDSASHLMNNMLVLFFLGDNLERIAGKWRYLIFYFGSGLIAGIVSVVYNMVNNYNVISIGASGAIFGVVGAMVNIVIRNRGRVENISARQMILFVIFSLYGGLTSQGVDNAAHIGGLVSGFILAAIFYRRPRKRIANNYRR